VLDDEPSTRTLSGFRAHRKAGGVKLLCELLSRVSCGGWCVLCVLCGRAVRVLVCS
jgi:hypothetical protein